MVDEEGVERLLAQKLALGGDASVAAGPIGTGRQGTVDTSVIGYAHAEGLFAGVQLGGSALTYAKRANTEAYGAEVPPRHVLFDTRSVPEALKPFQEALTRFAPPGTDS